MNRLVTLENEEIVIVDDVGCAIEKVNLVWGKEFGLRLRKFVAKKVEQICAEKIGPNDRCSRAWELAGYLRAQVETVLIFVRVRLPLCSGAVGMKTQLVFWAIARIQNGVLISQEQ